MGVADQRQALGLGVEAQLGQQGGEDVLPYGIARRRVIEPHAAHRSRGLQRLQPVAVAGVDDLLRPARGERGAGGELAEVEVAGHRQVVVAGQADVGVLARQPAAVVGIGAVAHHVAQAPDLLRRAGPDVGKDRLEGVTVAVDVGDDGDLHESRGRLGPWGILYERGTPPPGCRGRGCCLRCRGGRGPAAAAT